MRSFLLIKRVSIFFLFFFNDTATTEIYTLSLHDALPISTWPSSPWRSGSSAPGRSCGHRVSGRSSPLPVAPPGAGCTGRVGRSEEHTSELQSQSNLVCRLLLEKKNNDRNRHCRDKRDTRQ